MKIANQLEELLKAGVISTETATAIESYYQQRNNGQQNQSRLTIAFGILGATLMGLGIILIIAHNWDNLNRTTKTFFAFLPLVLGQVAGLFTLFKKYDSASWREGTAVFLFFAVSASIAMVSQIYNIPGDMASFLLTWMLLSLPLFYLLRSSLTALLYLIGITAFGVAEGYFNNTPGPIWTFWLLFIALLPYYYWLLKRKPEGNFTSFFNWLVPTSLIICLGLFSESGEELILLAYLLLLSLFYLIGNYRVFKSLSIFSNGYLIIGLLGSLVILLFLSFDDFWQSWVELKFLQLFSNAEIWLVIALLGVSIYYMILQKWKLKPLLWLPIFTFFIFIVGLYSVLVPLILVNIFYLLIGIYFIKEGAKEDHLGLLNLGLLIIASLVVARFFDANLSFVIRGFLFLFVGSGFFIANYKMLKKRKKQITR